MINKVLLITFLTLFSSNIYGQRDLDFLNGLPATEEIRSPVFNTIAKYNISVDSIYRNIYIQDIRISKEGELHFYQWLYELPLENLKFEPKITNENKISIEISSPTLGSTFISYWFQNNKISSVLNQKVITLGNWENTNENLEIVQECTRKLSDYFSAFIASEKNSNDTESGSFKYTANNVTKVNVKMDSDSKIGAYSFDPFFDENNRPKSTKLLSSLRKETKKNILDNNSPIAVLIYSSADGNFETIQLINSNSDFPKQFDPLKIKPINKTNIPTKNLLLLY